MRPAVALSHPSSNPNARWTAEALLLAGGLHSVYTSVDPRRWLGGQYFAGRPAYQRRVWPVPADRLRQNVLPDLLGRLTSRLFPLARRDAGHDLAYLLHDLMTAARLERDISALYGYEDGCARTFKAARRLGLTTVLELPAGHYREVQARSQAMQSQGRGPGFSQEPAWKLARKRAELEGCDLIVAPCPYVLQQVRAWSPDTPVVLGRYAMPADELEPRLDPPAGALKLVYVGALSWRKGVYDLLRAWSDLRAWEGGASLTLLGRAPLEPELQRGLSLPGVVHRPPAGRAQVAELLRSSDLLVLPSWCEGFGLVIGEALACGTPVLATRSTGALGVIEPGQQGWLYDADDEDTLRLLLDQALRDPPQVRELRSQARQLAETWSPARVLPQLGQDLLRAIASTSRPVSQREYDRHP